MTYKKKKLKKKKLTKKTLKNIKGKMIKKIPHKYAGAPHQKSSESIRPSSKKSIRPSSKKSIRPSIYKSSIQKITSVKSIDIQFQNLIDFLGGPVLLTEFSNFLGRVDCDMCDIFPEKIRGFRPSEHAPCLAFDGVHWKGYDIKDKKLITYDSYTSKVQLTGTNNFCQSFACYLWSNKGDLKELIPGKYAKNIQCISRKWLDYFKQANKKLLNTEITNANDELTDSDPDYNTFTLTDIKSTLTKLVNDDNFAGELATSKEDIF